MRLSGAQAIRIGQELFRCQPPLGERVRRVEYGRIAAGGREIDTGLAWVLRAPRSYTGEDTVEISCHGSDLVLRTVVEEAVSRGAVLAAPGEFTRRAFLSGQLDLVQAEAVVELIQAGSRDTLASAYGTASGRLSTVVREVKGHLVTALALVEVGLDFADEDVGRIDPKQILDSLQEANSLARRLVDTFEGSRRREQGASVALVGRPNVGKSTLLNALLTEERAIVSSVPGTTRDLVEGQCVWRGELVRLVDTAGLRAVDGAVEREGVARARRAAEEADLVVAVLDLSRPWEEADREVLDFVGRKRGLVLLNKMDLPHRLILPASLAEQLACLPVSALTGEGMELLPGRALDLLPRPNVVDGVCLTRQRHADCLARVVSRTEAARELLLAPQLEECVASELQEGLQALAELLGESVGEEVLDRIFSEFCIGK